MAEAPLVSAIMIFLDAERFIEEAIESVLAQTYKSWELLLVDDGSSDASTGIAKRYAAEHPDRIRWLEHPGHENRGMSAARNLGITDARGKYLALLDADDVWRPTRLERHVQLLERDSEVALVYGPTRYWFSWTGKPDDADRDFESDLMVEPGRRFEPPELLLRYLVTRGGASPCPSSLSVRRAAAIEVGGFEDRFRAVSEDQVFFAKLWLVKPTFVLGECLDRYRQHRDSSSERALAAGQYHPKRPNPAQRAYLDWLEGYLDANGVRDRRLRRALRKLQIPYRNPRLYPLVNLPHRARDAADFARRSLRDWFVRLGAAAGLRH